MKLTGGMEVQETATFVMMFDKFLTFLMSQTFPIQYINVSLSRSHFIKEVISDLLYVVMLNMNLIDCLFYTQWLEQDFL